MKEKYIGVIDLKAFYAYVECVDRGLDAWKAPLVVADVSRSVNTIILSVSPYLKSKGVPSRLRIKELPDGFDYIYAVPRMERYIEKSCEIISIILDFISEEDIHVYSIDESFVDLTSYISYYQKTPKEIIKMILDTIKDKTGLEATAGIGDSFFLAKVALDNFAKKEHDGIAEIYKKDVKEKVWPITPLTKIWGIGPRIEKRLNNIGIYKVEELAKADRSLISNMFGIIGEQLIDHANGIDESDVHEHYVPKEKSLSFGQTLPRDYSSKEIYVIIRELCDDLASKLRSQELTTSVVSLAIIYSSSQGGFSRQMSLLRPSDDGDVLFKALMEIFNKFIEDKPIRQVHINFAHLRPYQDYEQLDIFNEKQDLKGKHDLQLMIDKIHKKYGKNIIVRASALTSSSTAIERHNQIGGHRK